MKQKLFIIASALIITLGAHAQQGLFISTNKADSSSTKTFHEFGSSIWHQTSADKSSYGAFYKLHKYLPQTLSSFRLYSGVYGSSDKLHSIGDFNNHLIKQSGPGWEAGTGVSRLLPQGDNKFEAAINADLYMASRYPNIGDIKSRLTTFHARAGIELIPFPAKISFYGNVNFILGASGTNEFLRKLSIPTDSDPIPLLVKAEYFDVGIKYRLRKGKFIFTPDVNLILAERRIVNKSSDFDWVIPNVSLEVSLLFPAKN